MSRFRPVYRELTEEEKVLHNNIKDAYLSVELLLDKLNPGRYKALAVTSLEESCMWAIKELTT